MNTHKEMVSKDGQTYTLTVTEDVIKLTPKQIEAIEKKISTLDAIDVESEYGINIFLGDQKQKDRIIETINGILGELSVNEILDLQIVDFTGHAKHDRVDNQEICIERNWSHSRAKEEIVEALKDAYDVEQVRIRFSSTTKKSWDHFSFRVIGLVGNTTKEVVISFEPDPEEDSTTIMVVTIL